MPRLRPRAFAPFNVSGHRANLDTTMSTESKSSDPLAEGVAKIIALIPAESVAAYQSIYNLTNNGKSPLFNAAVWLILVGTPFWQLYATRGKNEPLAIGQAIISIPAFYIWLVGLQSPFLHLPSDWTPVENAVILIVGTFILPLVAWGLELAISFIFKKKS